MAVTAPTDVAAWVPHIISAKSYDTTFASRRALTALAATYGDLDGKPGESFVIPTVGLTAPADNLAVTTPAVDDKLSGDGVEIVVKESVKSIAFFDRTKWATGTDFQQLAGQRVGAAQADRIELDLGAALIAGRNVAADETVTTLDLGVIRQMRSSLPSALRGGLDGTEKPILLSTDDVLDELYGTTIISNAGAFGSDEALREGDFTRPVAGVRLRTVDDVALPAHPTPGMFYMAIMAPGMLVRAMQKQPSTEPERDARARLTRIVGTQNHAEGVIDPRGVVVFTLDLRAA